MADSLEKTARAAIKAWIESLALTPTPTVVQVEEPKPDAHRTLPTFEVQFGAESWNVNYREQVSNVGNRAILDYGEIETDARFVWRCGSESDAESFREQFRSRFLLYAEAAGKLADTPVVKLSGSFFGVYDAPIHLYLNRPDNLVYPAARETGVVDYWVLAHSLVVTFPLLLFEPLPGTGFMDVLIEVGQPEDPFDMNNYGGP